MGSSPFHSWMSRARPTLNASRPAGETVNRRLGRPPRIYNALTAVTSDLSDVDGLGAFSYQWQRDTGGGFVDISGETADAYAVTTTDVGSTIRVIVSYTDGYGTLETVISEVATVSSWLCAEFMITRQAVGRTKRSADPAPQKKTFSIIPARRRSAFG